LHFGTITFVTHDKFHGAMKSATSKNARRRQYKKDTLYVLDLYTLTYDSHETLGSWGDYVSSTVRDITLFSSSRHSSFEIDLRVDKHRSFLRCCSEPLTGVHGSLFYVLQLILSLYASHYKSVANILHGTSKLI
jgi:hypothetical protein